MPISKKHCSRAGVGPYGPPLVSVNKVLLARSRTYSFTHEPQLRSLTLQPQRRADPEADSRGNIPLCSLAGKVCRAPRQEPAGPGFSCVRPLLSVRLKMIIISCDSQHLMSLLRFLRVFYLSCISHFCEDRHEPAPLSLFLTRWVGFS